MRRPLNRKRENEYAASAVSVMTNVDVIYGKTAVPINAELQKKALKGYPRGEKPITCRPAEVLAPELEKAKAEIGDLAVDIDDLILYAIYPVTGKKFLEWKYGKAEVPASVKPITMEEVKKKDEIIKKAKAGLLVEKKTTAPPKSDRVRTFNVFVDNEHFSVDVDPTGDAPGHLNADESRRSCSSSCGSSSSACSCRSGPCRTCSPYRSGYAAHGSDARHDRQI